MSKEIISGLPNNSDLLFKVGISCIIIIIIYFVYNLFSKMKEINDKLGIFLTETQNDDLIKDTSEDTPEESKVDLSGIESTQDLEPIEE